MFDISFFMYTLTLQSFIQQQWQDMATLYFDDHNFELLKFTYFDDYIFQNLTESGYAAPTINYPVNFFIDQYEKQWLTFLDDIIPAGASQRYWLQALDIQHLPVAQQRFILLAKGAISPIGNLRIKEAVPKNLPIRYFQMEDVIDRNADFLEYAHQQGAIVGGATGAGGEAPKLLLRQKENHVWIDNQQFGTDEGNYYLVKYPRGQRKARDCDILRTEYHYYQELASMGFDTISTEKMRLEEGKHYPSLWLPRFDIIQDETGKIIKRYAVESVYVMLQKHGGILDHYTTLADLIQRIQQSGLQFDTESFVKQWVLRDLLNIAFGNSDNHGRNTAFLRTQNHIQLAPIYDFAPMRADLDEIIRSMTWKYPLESGGEYQFNAICEQVSEWVDPHIMLNALKHTAQQLSDLKTRLAKRGVPQSILELPKMGFDFLPEKLQRWGLI